MCKVYKKFVISRPHISLWDGGGSVKCGQRPHFIFFGGTLPLFIYNKNSTNIREGSFKKKKHIWAGVPTGGGGLTESQPP